MAELAQIAEALIRGDRDTVVKLVNAALEEKVPVEEILNQGLIAGMDEVGRRFQANEFYVPELLIAARAMSAGMDIIEPILVESGIEPAGTIAIGTVKGDLHDIGKNLVGMMLKGGGFSILDLGVDVDAQKFVDAAKNDGAKILALSALLTTTMPQMAEVIKTLKDSGVEGVKVIIGGAPITQEYADEIGADGYGPDAASAVAVARQLIGN
ncbi:MAG: corrinoid protein [Planctomycetia bacterium]|nr:corrinoid protein [Planctomycetia bacterium]